MLFVYADKNLADIKALKPISAEFAFGSDENDFSLVMPYQSEVLEAGYYVYVDGSEYGGMLCDIETDKTNHKRTYSGVSWQGLLAQKILMPDAGADYLTVTGDAHTLLTTLIKRIGLNSIMSVSSATSAYIVKNFQFERYVDAYSGIRAMLKSVGATLKIECSASKVILSAVAIQNHETSAVTTTYSRPVNHLICLGKGELKDRTVIHFYANAKGAISQTQTLKGAMENAEVYDYSSAEEDALKAKGKEKLSEYQVFYKAELNEITGTNYRVDDNLITYDSANDTTTTEPITKKIVSINSRGRISVQYTSDDSAITYSSKQKGKFNYVYGIDNRQSRYRSY